MIAHLERKRDGKWIRTAAITGPGKMYRIGRTMRDGAFWTYTNMMQLRAVHNIPDVQRVVLDR